MSSAVAPAPSARRTRTATRVRACPSLSTFTDPARHAPGPDYQTNSGDGVGRKGSHQPHCAVLLSARDDKSAPRAWHLAGAPTRHPRAPTATARDPERESPSHVSGEPGTGTVFLLVLYYYSNNNNNKINSCWSVFFSLLVAVIS